MSLVAGRASRAGILPGVGAVSQPGLRACPCLAMAWGEGLFQGRQGSDWSGCRFGCTWLGAREEGQCPAGVSVFLRSHSLILFVTCHFTDHTVLSRTQSPLLPKQGVPPGALRACGVWNSSAALILEGLPGERTGSQQVRALELGAWTFKNRWCFGRAFTSLCAAWV